MNVRIATAVFAAILAGGGVRAIAQTTEVAAAPAQVPKSGPAVPKARPVATIVILPVQDLSGADEAAHAVAVKIGRSLAARGWSVASSDEVEPLLEKERVRYLDSLDDDVRQRLAEATGASAFVATSLFTYAEGRNPIVGIAARMVRVDGTVAWGDVAGMSGDETEAVLGFGRQTTAAGVADVAVGRLLRHFPRPGEEGAIVRRGGKGLLRSGPEFFRAAELDPATPHKVCILPFNNLSDAPEATRIVSEVLAVRLAAENGFEVVEPAVLRAAALKARIGSFRWIASEHLVSLAAVVGTPLFLQGTIYRYGEGSRSQWGTPEFHVELTLVDVERGRVLWAAQHDRRGTDYTGFLMRGTATTAVSLADRVLGEIVETASHGKATGTAGGLAARNGKKRSPERHSALRGATTGEQK